MWREEGQRKNCRVPAPRSRGNAASVLMLCLPKHDRSKAGGEAALFSCCCLPCFHLQDGYTEPRAGTMSCPFTPPPNLCISSGLQHYPNKASHNDGRA